jgi:hypothetical protein
MHQARQHSGARARERRHLVAHEAARWMTQSVIRHFQLAKPKASMLLRIHDEACLPRNSEIEEALRAYQRLFSGDDQSQHVLRLRQAAVEAMNSLQAFDPRLTGAVLDGTADARTAVQLHVFVDAIFEFDDFLQRAGIKALQRVRKLKLDRVRTVDVDVRLLTVDGIDFDIAVLPRDYIRQAPLSHVTEKPMARASLKQVSALLEG